MSKIVLKNKGAVRNKAVFLDRDGIINEEIGDYVYDLENFNIVPGIIDVLRTLKEQGFYLVVITNQAGIAKGRYGHKEVRMLHDHFQEKSGELIDHFYYAPSHPDYSESLGRKPGTLLFEKAMAKFSIDPSQSWMVGDKERDLVPAKQLGMRTIRLFLEEAENTIGDHSIQDVSEILGIIH